MDPCIVIADSIDVASFFCWSWLSGQCLLVVPGHETRFGKGLWPWRVQLLADKPNYCWMKDDWWIEWDWIVLLGHVGAYSDGWTWGAWSSHRGVDISELQRFWGGWYFGAGGVLAQKANRTKWSKSAKALCLSTIEWGMLDEGSELRQFFLNTDSAARLICFKVGLSKCLGTARHVQVEAPPRIHEVPAGWEWVRHLFRLV